jgi:hypothetical protein
MEEGVHATHTESVRTRTLNFAGLESSTYPYTCVIMAEGVAVT